MYFRAERIFVRKSPHRQPCPLSSVGLRVSGPRSRIRPSFLMILRHDYRVMVIVSWQASDLPCVHVGRLHAHMFPPFSNLILLHSHIGSFRCPARPAPVCSFNISTPGQYAATAWEFSLLPEP